MAPTPYSKAGLPETILGIPCSAHRAWSISYVLSYYKVNIRKSATKIELLTALDSFAPTVSQNEQRAIVNWFQSHNATLTGLAASIIAAKNLEENDMTNTVATGSTMHDSQGAECPVCLEHLTAESFPQGKITSTCVHEPTFCKDCLTKYVGTRVHEYPWSKVFCPECKETFSDEEVQIWTSSQAFEKHKQNAAMSKIHHLPNFIRCLAPDCGAGQLHDDSDAQPIMTCEACGFQTCPRHKLPYHDGQTCEEYDSTRQEQIEQEATSEKYLAETTKICPGPGCGIHTIKEGRACDHITCKQCRFDYCWVCLIPYDMVRHIGGSAHARDCNSWTDLTPSQYRAARSAQRQEKKGQTTEASAKRQRAASEDDSRGPVKKSKGAK
ncbi:hypothetical protein VTL71DRAFT_15298 [Oculimacula yallundae]|uniref:RBR-type E3 ubiquitin transferase n=1 Tax=Oculimacula yallundae TaxID=86028 RepID=A0ABR4CG67_9HELO